MGINVAVTTGLNKVVNTVSHKVKLWNVKANFIYANMICSISKDYEKGFLYRFHTMLMAESVYGFYKIAKRQEETDSLRILSNLVPFNGSVEYLLDQNLPEEYYHTIEVAVPMMEDTIVLKDRTSDIVVIESIGKKGYAYTGFRGDTRRVVWSAYEDTRRLAFLKIAKEGNRV